MGRRLADWLPRFGCTGAPSPVRHTGAQENISPRRAMRPANETDARMLGFVVEEGLHFLSLLVSQLEQSADMLEEAAVELPPPPPVKLPRKRKPRAKKLTQQASTEGKPDDA